MRLAWLSGSLLAVSLLAACNNSKPGSHPLGSGDAEWPPVPIPHPGSNGNGDDDDDGNDDEGDGDASTSLGFVPSDDLGGVSECDPFMQDCPEGEKCVAYASTGGPLDANKCVPVTGDGMPGEMCIYDGVVEATDDCDAVSYCWDVTDVTGTCTQFCAGTADAPVCPEGLECLLAYDGALNLCVDNAGETGETGAPDIEEPEVLANPEDEQLEQMCPDEPDPVVLYMSNDDSNSQASLPLVRWLIHKGQVVPQSYVRIHEFLNYYTIASDYPVTKPAKVGMQMRRTNAETGEFALLLTAKGQQLREEDRPPFNLVFSLDTSGSMSGEPLELVKDSMRALAGELRSGDVISVVQWSDAQAVLLENHWIVGPNDPALLAVIDGLQTGGSTNLHGGLVTAYQVGQASHIEDGINRVILMSDGGANAGVTELSVIANAAAAEDGSGIYLVGVGVGGDNYHDLLMDQLTDAGKGAYIFIDDSAEAERQFTDRFLANVAVAARNVSMRVTLPWYFGVKTFHGEEYSADPAEVEPQHLAPNDAMSFHQIISACDPEAIDELDTIEARIEYLHPLTLQPMNDNLTVEIGALVVADAKQLHKADVVVGFAKALIVIGAYMSDGQTADALVIAQDVQAWLAQAGQQLGDPEVMEMAALMGEYALVIKNQ
jgi:Mg-chelatase subunit ChlD